MRRNLVSSAAGSCALALLTLGSPPGARAETDPELEALKRQVEALARQNESMQGTIEALRQEVRDAREEALAAQDLASAGERRLPPASAARLAEPLPDGALLSRQVGRASFQLLDVSLVGDVAAGTSQASDEEIELLQGGGHDPRQRGFTLQQVELSFLGAVDPYFTGEAHVVYFLDTEGESRFEIEEAFATTTMLPFGLEEHGLQLELGQFFTEFGRINPQHAHQWDWLDQPFVLSRFFGGDGMRGPGFRLGWLTPLPWFSELHLGMQNAKGEPMVSFLANDEVFEERPIGGRPFAGRKVDGFDDFVYLARWVNGFDLSDTLSTQLGVSALFGPNATGDDGHTYVVGGDVVAKWRPLSTDHGWPFVIFQGEFLYRDYRADDFFDCVGLDEDEPCLDPVAIGDEHLRDWGLYAQLLWGFQRSWAAGVRYEYGGGDNPNVAIEDDMVAAVSRSGDPYRGTRHRVSPLIEFEPSDFSRIRLQYSYDHVSFLGDEDVHSVWAGLEFSFGAHGAHAY